MYALSFFYKHWLINRFACRSRRIFCRWSRVVTWGARALCIVGCNCEWSRGEPKRSVLVVAQVGHVVKWQVEWHVVDDIIDLHTACCHYVILVDESIVGRFCSVTGHRSRCRRRGGRLCCSLLHCDHIFVVLRKVEADQQADLYNYPIRISPNGRSGLHQVMSFVSQFWAVRFRQANDHFSFGRVRSRLGRKSWVSAARVACAEAVWDSKFYASKLYQRNAK